MTDLGYTLRAMKPEDYDQVYALWERIQGFALRSVDDSREYVERFLRRNPTTSVVALVDGQVAGTILCGHDGRQGKFYHVCVAPEHRKLGIGRAMVKFSLAALAEEGGRTYIYTACDEKNESLLNPVEVTTGISDGENVEILSGLAEGDTYCYYYAGDVQYNFV